MSSDHNTLDIETITAIEDMWNNKSEISTTTSTTTQERHKSIIREVINALDKGDVRVASKVNNEWIINEVIKKAILLSFSINDNKIINKSSELKYFDKSPLKYSNWSEEDFRSSESRIVPDAIVRKGAYIGKKVVLMNSWVNIGAYIDNGTMIDSFALVGSCAQVGKNCHISAHITIGGVLEPLNANPVIIEDNCIIGAGCRILEGAIIGTNSVIAPNTVITAHIPIIDRETGETYYGKVPPNCLVVSGTRKITDKLHTNVAVIMKRNVKPNEITNLLRK